jgi:four helix bundle protein
MTCIRSFEDVEVWKTGREIVCQLYFFTRRKLFAGNFALRAQLRRASISIISNIAEGYESQTSRIFVRHLAIAKGSAGEVGSQLYIALDQNYMSKAEFDDLSGLCKKVSRQLSSLIQYLTYST